MNIDSKNRNFILIIIVSLVIIILGVIAFEVFKFTQQNKENSLSRGYGYYSDPIKGPCINNSNDCSVPGVRKVYKKMIIHPVTRRCALQEDGTQTCDDIVEYQPCQQQCLGTQVEIYDGIQMQKITTQQTTTPVTTNLQAVTQEVTKDLEILVPTGSGNNKIINKFGIDLTDEYMGTFNSLNNTYELKKCISESENLIFYNTETRLYTTKDESGDKATFFTCGVDDIKAMRQNNININGQPFNDYPFVETLNGEKHYECLDILGNNQLSFINNINTDTNFYPQPDVCYEIFKEDYNSNIIEVKDVDIYGPSQDRITISDSNIDLNDYNLIYDFNDYRLITSGKNNLIIDRIVKNQKIISKNSSNINKYIYLDCSDLAITLSRDNRITFHLTNTDSQYYDFSEGLPTNGYGIFKDKYLVLNLNIFLQNNPSFNVAYHFYDGYIELNNYNDFLSPNNHMYIFYKIDNDNIDDKCGIAKVVSMSSTNNKSFRLIVNEEAVPDMGQDAYTYGIRIYLLDNTNIESLISISNVNDSITIQASNLIENNNFFLSDLLLDDSDNHGIDSDDNDLIKLTSLPLDMNIGMYIFGTEINSDQKSFHYPLLMNFQFPDDPNYSQITFKEYGNIIFYYNNQEYKSSSLPPNKLLNYKHYDDIVNTIVAKIIIDSYSNKVVRFIKQIIILSSGTNNVYNKYSYNNNHFFLYGTENAPDNTYTIKFVNTENDIIQDILNINTGVNNQLVEKLEIYNIFKDNESLYKSENITISPLQSIVKKADFRVFRSPYLIRGNQSSPICFDGNNHRIPNGQKIDINAGDKLITYKRGTEINADKFQCGAYGLSGGQAITQVRNNQTIRFIEEDNIKIFDDKSRYNNHLNFLEEGYQKESDIYCLDNYSIPYDSSSNRKCKEPFITKELSTTDNYNPNEEYFKSFTDDYYFISNNDNNNNIPQINQSWSHISNYEIIKYIRPTELAYTDKNNFKIVYSCTGEGATGSNLFDLATNYVFNKAEPTYKFISYTADNYSTGIEYNSPYDTTIQSVLIKNDIDNVSVGYPYKNYLYGISIISSSQNSTDSNLQDLTISLNTNGQGQINDIFNPDFNLFNYILVKGLSVFSLGISTQTNFQFYNNLNSTTIDIDTDNIEVNDIIYIGYTDTDLNNIHNIISTSDSYNHNFEICKILDINDNIVTLERNLLNLDPKNLLYNNIIPETLNFTGFKLPSNFNLDLFFPITGKNSNNIEFKISLYFNDTTISNIEQNNYRFRTAASMRIFKQDISIPSQSLPNNKNIYLLEDSNNNTFSSIMSDCDIDSLDFEGKFYFREYNDKIFDNNYKPVFNIGDAIAIEFKNIDYPFRIIGLNKYYNNIFYHYECVYIGALTPPENKTFKDILPFLYSTQLYYYYYINLGGQMTEYTYCKLFSSSTASDPDKIKITKTPGSVSLTSYLNNRLNATPEEFDIEEISDKLLKETIFYPPISIFYDGDGFNFPYSFSQNITFNLSDGTPVNIVPFTSYDIDMYNNIGFPKVKLLSTRAYSANVPSKYITISNLEANYKPFGPYFMKDHVINDNVDRSGYSTITSFTVDISQDNNIDDTDLFDGALFITDNGTKFSITSSNLATFKFETARKIKNIDNYIIEKSYNKNQIVNYPINKVSFYKNISNNTSLSNVDNPPFYVYGTDTSRSQTKGYYYPLYLKVFENTHNHTFTEFPGIIFYMPNQFISNHALSDPPTNSHYREFTNSSFQISDIWRQQSHNEYGLDILTNYNINKNYNKDSYVSYEGFVWQAMANIQSGVSPTSGSDWEKVFKSRDYTNDNNETSFFNINYQDNTIVNMRKAALENVGSNPFILYNTESMGVSTFITGVNAFDYTSKIYDTYIQRYYYDDKRPILGKTLMFKDNNNNLISLASSPTTLTDYQNYRFLRGNKNQFNHDLLSQYLYNISLPDKSFTGKETCVGNYSHAGTENITNYEFANSANFMIIPLDISSQDYPSIVYDSSVRLYDMPINKLPSGEHESSVVVMRKNSDGNFQINYNVISISYKRSILRHYTLDETQPLPYGLNNFKTKNNVIILQDSFINGDFKVNDIWYLKENDNPAFYINGTDTSKSQTKGYYYPLYLKNNFPGLSDQSSHTHTFTEFPGLVFYMPNQFINNHALVDPPSTLLKIKEYTNDIEIDTNKVIAYGLITKVNGTPTPGVAVNSITTDCLYTISAEENYSEFNLYKFYTRGLVNINDENIPHESNRSRYITCKMLTELYLISEDSYIDELPTNYYNTEYDLKTDDNNFLIPPDKLSLSNPSQSLENGDIIYFILNTANDRKQDIKCRIYGFFGKSYLSSIIYNSEKKIMSNLGISIPVMAMKPYNNQLLCNLQQDIQLLDSDGSNVIISQYNYSQYNDIFTIKSKGTSLELVSHPFKKPIGASNNIFFPKCVNLPTGVISTPSVTDLIAEQFDINNNVILGGVSDIVPTTGQHDDKANLYRQLKGGANLNSSLNCNIFETELNNTGLFPYGDTYNLYLLNNNGVITSKIIDLDTGVTSIGISTIYYNQYFSLTQLDSTNKGFPLYIGTSPGASFNNSIIQDNKRIDDNSVIRVAYLLNNKQVSHDFYHKLTNFNDKQYLNKEVRIVYQNEGSSNLGQRQLYMGISGANIPLTYLEQNIQLIFKDESS